MTTLEERIAELMAATGWTIGQLADIAEVSSSAVSQWANGQTQSIKLEPAIRIERASGFSALWLANGKGVKKSAAPPTLEDGDEAHYAGKPRVAKRIPVVGTAQMGNDGFYEEMSAMVGAGDGHIEIATDDPNAFCIRVRGQSMFPAIRDGWYVLVEPNGVPCVGEYVLLRLVNGKKMVKELLNRRSGSLEVMSVNGGTRMSFDMTEVESVHAIGAVVSPSKWMPN
ncbi:LexA family transcriptional regulator [Variovorax sp. LT1R16]|uniref:LexA family transcriptional regulator n=1 Tax=Variovorax sp. LT1R16 TaxID=3443728 RepID=UPI003F472430